MVRVNGGRISFLSARASGCSRLQSRWLAVLADWVGVDR